MLVLLAVDDRQVWVEVGYDLEGVITDGFAGETSRQVDGALLPPGRLRRRVACGHVPAHRAHRRRPPRRRSPASRSAMPRSAHAIPCRLRCRFSSSCSCSSCFRSWRDAAARAVAEAGAVAPDGGAAVLRRHVGRGLVVGWLVRRVRRIRRRTQRRRWRRRVVVVLGQQRGGIMRKLMMSALVCAGGDSGQRLLLQHVCQPGRGRQGAVGAGREPAAAAQRPHPEPRGDHEGLRPAGTRRLRGHRRFARQAGRRAGARRKDAGGQRAVDGARAVAGRRRELPGTASRTRRSPG